MTTRSQGINRKIPILISVLLLQSVAITINASNDGFSGESHFSHPPNDVDLTPWTIDCYDDFEATWIWQSDNQPTGIDSPTDSDFGFSDRFGVGITDLEDGTFKLENSDGDTEIWDGWTNGTTIQIPDISNLSRTYACYAEEFQWDDDTWRFSHNSTCENEYFLDSDNTFAVFDHVFWHDYLSPYYHWSSNWEELDDGTINNYVAKSYFAIDGSPYIGNLTDNAGMTQIVDIRLHDMQTEFDYDNHYAEDLHNKTQKAIGSMGAAGSDVLSYETHLMDLSQINWVSLSGKGTLSDLASPPDISIDEDIEWRISLCEVYNYVFYLETSRDIFGFRWVAFDPEFVQEEDEQESLVPSDREWSNWALDCENQFPFDFVWMSSGWDSSTPPGLVPVNQSHENTFRYNNNGIGITLLPNGTYQVDVIGWDDSLYTQYWTSNSSMPAFEIPTLETFSLQLPCYYSHFGNSLGSFNPSHGSCSSDVLIDLDNPTGMIDHYFDDSQSYWWPFNSWINHYLWSNGSAWNGNMIVENKISIISTNSTVQRDSDGQNDWSTYSTVLTFEESNVGSTNRQYITNSHDGSIRYVQGMDTIGDIDQVPGIILPANYEWKISLCRLSASVGIYDPPYSIDAFRWVALPEPLVIEVVPGCTDHFANNHDANANEDDGSCDYDLDNDGVLDSDEIAGCTDPVANNYLDTATEEDGTCDYDLDDDGVLDSDEVLGCTDPVANNHSDIATDDDGSCDYDLDDDGVLDSDEVLGCTDYDAQNYNPESTEEDDTCEYQSDEEAPLLDELASEEDPEEPVRRIIPTLIIENSQPITMLALMSMLGTAFVQAESLRYQFSKKFWLGMAFMVGATRKDHRGEFQRGRIVGILTTNQGIHLSALIRILGLGNHQAAHHLSVLEEQGDIWNKRVGREIRFFTSDVPRGTETGDLPSIDVSINENSIPYRILVILYENQDVEGNDSTQKEISAILKTSKQLVSYHIRILEERGFVERNRRGLGYRVSITPEGTRHILDDKHIEGSQIGIDQSILFDSIMNLNIEN